MQEINVRQGADSMVGVQSSFPAHGGHPVLEASMHGWSMASGMIPSQGGCTQHLKSAIVPVLGTYPMVLVLGSAVYVRRFWILDSSFSCFEILCKVWCLHGVNEM